MKLIKQMDECGVLGSGRMAKAVSILVEMFKDPKFTVFLTLAGPMVPGGLRYIIKQLIDQKYINSIISSGANIVHDILESMGYKGIKGSFSGSDTQLKKMNYGRVGDIYIDIKGFETLEKKMYQVFDKFSEIERSKLPVFTLISKIGSLIEDDESILKSSYKNNVPIFCPGIFDSMIGFHAWTYNQTKILDLNPLFDLNKLSEIIYESKKVGAIILGGGLPKHHVLGANTLRDGVDAAVQITLDRPEGGSMSGAPLEEAISWKKAKNKDKIVTVIGDATLIFPFMIQAVFEILQE